MRTASGYQAPAVPYHTPIVTDFSTPNLILPSGTRNILPTETQICIASIGKMKKIILDDGKRKIEN
jgi:hypothetical protein